MGRGVNAKETLAHSIKDSLQEVLRLFPAVESLKEYCVTNLCAESKLSQPQFHLLNLPVFTDPALLLLIYKPGMTGEDT